MDGWMDGWIHRYMKREIEGPQGCWKKHTPATSEQCFGSRHRRTAVLVNFTVGVPGWHTIGSSAVVEARQKWLRSFDVTLGAGLLEVAS